MTMPVSRDTQAIQALVAVLQPALNAALPFPGMVIRGWPTGDQLPRITGNGGGQVSLVDMPGTARFTPRYVGQRGRYINGALVIEIGRVTRNVQVCIWAGDPDKRDAVRAVVEYTIGNADSTFIPIGDGTTVRVTPITDAQTDEAQNDYGLFEMRMVYACEYGILAPPAASGASAATPVQHVEAVLTADGDAPDTIVVPPIVP